MEKMKFCPLINKACMKDLCEFSEGEYDFNPDTHESTLRGRYCAISRIIRAKAKEV